MSEQTEVTVTKSRLREALSSVLGSDQGLEGIWQELGGQSPVDMLLHRAALARRDGDFDRAGRIYAKLDQALREGQPYPQDWEDVRRP